MTLTFDYFVGKVNTKRNHFSERYTGGKGRIKREKELHDICGNIQETNCTHKET